MINKTFRLFISSTFNDFIDEREILNGQVLDTVDAYCQQRGYNFQLIDLRWGIAEESSLSQKTLSICLDEVRRCRTLSPKPNFLLMVGERYGWIPIPSSIKKAEFDLLLAQCAEEEQDFVCQWYLYDANTIGGEYYLRGREGVFVAGDMWVPVEDRLCIILTNAAVKAGLDEKNMLRYTASATEHEILEGFLANDELCENVIAFFRVGHSVYVKDQEKIQSLRQRIESRMQRDGNSENLLTLDYGETYNEQFCQMITSSILKNVAREIDRIEQVRNADRGDTSAQYIHRLSESFYIRNRELAELQKYIEGKDRHPLFVTGDSGSGKTSLLAKFISDLDRKCYYSFFGQDDTSYTLVDSIHSICRAIQSDYSIRSQYHINTANLAEVFWDTLLSVPADKELVIVLDGLDMFYDLGDISNMLFHHMLPSHAKVIVSVAAGSPAAEFIAEECGRLEIQSLSPNESSYIFGRMLEAGGHHIADPFQEKIVYNILDNGCTPLQIRLLADICVGWRSTDVVEPLPTSPEAMALTYIESMFNRYGHDRELVLYSVAFILSAPYGLGEEELQQLLPRVGIVRQNLIDQSFFSNDFQRLPFAIWSRLFYDMENCLQLEYFKGHIVVKTAHKIFSTAFIHAYPEHFREAQQHLADYYIDMISCFLDRGTHLTSEKCISALTVLLNTERYKALDRFLLTPGFPDALVKAGSLAELLAAYRFRIQMCENSSVCEKLLEFESCLLRNQEMLRCYSGNTLMCLANDGVITSPAPIISYSNNQQNGFSARYFPYNASSIIALSPDKSLLAVGHNRYVYLCDNSTYNEYYRIYFPNGKEDDSKSISQLLWLGNDRLAVLCSSTELQIYDLDRKTANLRHTICRKFNTEIKIMFHQAYDFLLYVTEGKRDNNILFAFDLRTGKEIYHVPCGFSALSVILREDHVVIKKQFHLHYHKIEDGAYAYRIRYSSFKSDLMTHVVPLGGGLWAFYSGTFVAPVVIFREKRRRKITLDFVTCLYPPEYESVNDYKIGEGAVIFVYSDHLIWVDLRSGYTMYRVNLNGIHQVAWRDIGRELLVICTCGAAILNFDNIRAAGSAGTCFTSSRRIHLIRDSYYQLWSVLGWVFSTIFFDDYLLYKNVFSHSYEKTETVQMQAATIMTRAPNGAYAVVYEGADKLVIFNSGGNPVFAIDKLKLALNDSIHKIEFSPDSNYFLVWKTRSMHLLNLQTGKSILHLNLSWRPAADIYFTSDSSCLFIALADNAETYSFRIYPRKVRAVQKMPKRHGNKSFDLAPYYADLSSRKPPVSSLVSSANSANPAEWFKSDRMYFWKDNYLLFKNGNFYLNGKTDQHFHNSHDDFLLSLQQERLHDPSPLKGFLREKNDLLSKVYELQNKHILILILRMLNSIVVFDTDKMEILVSYKHHGNILGWRILDREDFSLELYSDESPYVKVITITVP